MVLNRKSFFLELGDPEPKKTTSKPKPKRDTRKTTKTSQPKAVANPVEEVIAAPVATATDTTPPTANSEVETKQKPSLTTAEAIAAELADAEAARPEVPLVTFAPEALQPGNSIRPGKRRPGSNLAGFRSMATDLFKS